MAAGVLSTAALSVAACTTAAIGASTRPASGGGGRTSTGGADRSGPTALAGAVVDGRFVAPVTVGGLTIDPASASSRGAPLGLDVADATADAGYTSGLGGVPTVGFGLVTVRGVATPVGTPALRRTPAWVGVVQGVNERAVSCPAEPAGRVPASAPFSPEDRAVVLYGAKGHGAVRYDTGGTMPCTGALIGPSLAAADATVPVPWVQQGPAALATVVSYRAPECASLTSTGGGGDVQLGTFTIEVTVTFPFSRVGCGAVRTFTATVRAYPSSVGPGAPPPPTAVTLVPSTAPNAVPASLVGPIP